MIGSQSNMSIFYNRTLSLLGEPAVSSFGNRLPTSRTFEFQRDHSLSPLFQIVSSLSLSLFGSDNCPMIAIIDELVKSIVVCNPPHLWVNHAYDVSLMFSSFLEFDFLFEISRKLSNWKRTSHLLEGRLDRARNPLGSTYHRHTMGQLSMAFALRSFHEPVSRWTATL